MHKKIIISFSKRVFFVLCLCHLFTKSNENANEFTFSNINCENGRIAALGLRQKMNKFNMFHEWKIGKRKEIEIWFEKQLKKYGF